VSTNCPPAPAVPEQSTEHKREARPETPAAKERLFGRSLPLSFPAAQFDVVPSERGNATTRPEHCPNSSRRLPGSALQIPALHNHGFGQTPLTAGSPTNPGGVPSSRASRSTTMSVSNDAARRLDNDTVTISPVAPRGPRDSDDRENGAPRRALLAFSRESGVRKLTPQLVEVFAGEHLAQFKTPSRLRDCESRPTS